MRPATENDAMLSRWAGTLEARAGKAAIRNGAGGVERSFGEIEAEARRLEQGPLARWGAGVVIGIQIGNSASWPALVLAARRRGMIPLPLGRHMEADERDAALRACGAQVLAEAAPAGEVRVVPRSTEERPDGPTECDFLKLTSGTTSEPRAIRFRSGQLVADCDNICETMGIGPEDLNFGVIPFSHSYGFSNLITPLLCLGVPLVATEDRLPRAILGGLARSEATVFPGMPLFFENLAEMEQTPKLPNLRLCISAGAPLTVRTGTEFTRRFGLKIHTFYGSSECGGIGYDASKEAVYEEGYIGTPMRGVRISAMEGGKESRIEVRSGAVGEGYFPKPDGEALGEGRFVPGDLVRMGPRGMYLAGRATDVINIAGRKLNPAEVEAQLARCPGVRQVVVFGVPSPLRHEEVVACVSGGAKAAEVLRFARTVLGAWQVPRDIWMVAELPVNERGKISRRELARRYSERCL